MGPWILILTLCLFFFLRFSHVNHISDFYYLQPFNYKIFKKTLKHYKKECTFALHTFKGAHNLSIDPFAVHQFSSYVYSCICTYFLHMVIYEGLDEVMATIFFCKIDRSWRNMEIYKQNWMVLEVLLNVQIMQILKKIS